MAKFTDDALRMKSGQAITGSSADRETYNDDTAERALQLVPVIPVVSPEYLVLEKALASVVELDNIGHTCMPRSCSIRAKIATAVLWTTGMLSGVEWVIYATMHS